MEGEDVLIEYGYENTKVWLWALILIIQIFIYRFGIYLALKRGFKTN